MSFPMHKPIKQWFISQYQDDDEREVLDVALVKRNTLYAAIKNKKTNDIFAVIFLIRWNRGTYNFSYKGMSEFSGPYEYECPKRIIKLLTPLTDENDPNGYARKWRKGVNEYWKKRELLKNKNGYFKTNDPISFISGDSYQYFKKIDKNLFAGRLENGVFKPICRVKVNLCRYDFEFVNCDF